MTSKLRWQSRRWASLLVRVLVFLLPLVFGVVVATLVARALPGYSGLPAGIAWWAAVLASSFVGVEYADRVASKFLPLAALLNMSLVFPGTAPSRVKVAMRTWTTAQLRARIREARDKGIDDDPTRAGETVLLLVAALNAHDHVTRGHAERTRAYTDVLAEELGVPIQQREKLRWVALLHDVGKLRIDEPILNKDGSLDEDEWEEVRKHPELGDRLVAPIKEFLEPWGDTVLHHHERWDGTGYPAGLAGEAINYGARIVAVADAYDAMTARRSYQPARNARDALRELSTHAGTQFDPNVVRAFLAISASRIRRLTGPLAMLAQIPFVAGLQRVAEWAGTATAGTAVVVAAVATGVVSPSTTAPPVTPAPTAAISTTQAPGTSTTIPDASVPVSPPGSVTTVPGTSGTSTTTSSAPPDTTSTTLPGATTTTTVPTTSTTSTTVPTTSTTSTTVPTTSTTTTTTTTTTTEAPANLPPVAAADTIEGPADSTFQIKVLDNDSDPDGDPVVLVSCSISAQGVETWVNDGKCAYRHPDPANWTTSDTFTYTVSDGQATATGTVTVTPR